MRYELLLILGLSLSLAGCGGRTTGNQASPPPQNQSVKTQQTAPSALPPASNQEITERLERLAASVPGVKSANCVVFGKTAVVGIDVDGRLDRSRVGTLKYSVAEALRKDPYGVNAVVTADMDVADRIREIREDMNNGRPLSGFANEMADIIGRIMPQVPRDIAPKSDPGSHPDANRTQGQGL